MSCGTQGRFVGLYITDPFLIAQGELECRGLCSINTSSCVTDFAAADCAVADDIPDGFPVNL